MEKMALLVAGIIFLVVAVMHFLRLIFKVEIKVNKYLVPQWLSLAGFIFALSVSIWMFKIIK